MEKQRLPLQIAPILFCFLITADRPRPGGPGAAACRAARRPHGGCPPAQAQPRPSAHGSCGSTAACGEPWGAGAPLGQLLQPVRAQSCVEGAWAAWGGHTAHGRVCGAQHGAGQARPGHRAWPQPWAWACTSVFTGWGYSPLPNLGLLPRHTGFLPQRNVWRGRRAGPGEGGGRAGAAGCVALGFSLVFPLQLR